MPTEFTGTHKMFHVTMSDEPVPAHRLKPMCN